MMKKCDACGVVVDVGGYLILCAGLVPNTWCPGTLRAHVRLQDRALSSGALAPGVKP
jgi:hypothetical protein